MPNCSVSCCNKRSATSNLQKDGVTFHMFPKDSNLWDTWKAFCNNKISWIPTKNSVICSTHFEASDFQVLTNKRRRLIDDAKPTLLPNCICSRHQQLFNKPDERLSSHNAISATIPDSLTSPCTSPTPQNTLITSKKYSSSPAIALTPRQRKMQNQLDFQKKKIKRLHAKNLYLKKKVAGLEEILQSIDEKALIDKEQRKVLKKMKRRWRNVKVGSSNQLSIHQT